MDNFDYISASGLVVTLALFVVIWLFRVRLKLGFTATVLGAMVAGIAVGFLFSGYTSFIRPIGTIYIQVLVALVAPLIIVSILSSVTSLGSLKALKNIGLKSVFWLLLTTAVAIVLSIALGLVFEVGSGADINIEGINGEIYTKKIVSIAQVITGFFPSNIVGDIADGKIIPIIVFAGIIAVSFVLVSSEKNSKGEPSDKAAAVQPFKAVVDAAKTILYKAVGFIIELTPYAVLALMACNVGSELTKDGIFWSLLVLLLVSIAACIIETWLVLGVFVSLFAKLNPLKFFKKIIPAQVVAFTTQASVGTLPVTTKVLQERVGVSTEIANFTAPLGTTIGMPGCSAVWPVLVAIYGINGLGLPYGPFDYLLLGIVCLFVALGTAGVPGTATITAVTALTAVGLPVEIVVLTVPIASIADTFRTACNVTAAITASSIVARSENELDDEIFNDRAVFTSVVRSDGGGI